MLSKRKLSNRFQPLAAAAAATHCKWLVVIFINESVQCGHNVVLLYSTFSFDVYISFIISQQLHPVDCTLQTALLKLVLSPSVSFSLLSSTALLSPFQSCFLPSSFRAMDVGDGSGGNQAGDVAEVRQMVKSSSTPSASKFGSLYSHCQVCGVMVPLKAGATLGL